MTLILVGTELKSFLLARVTIGWRLNRTILIFTSLRMPIPISKYVLHKYISNFVSVIKFYASVFVDKLAGKNSLGRETVLT